MMVVLYKGMKGGCVFVGFLLLGIVTSAQSSIKSAISQSAITNSSVLHEVRELKVGDVVPDITFQKVLNYKSSTARLSDFRGKLVILDIWSVWCSSCIAGFPKLEKLQEKYNDKIQILLVNPHVSSHDSEEKILSVLKKFKDRTGFYPTLPIPIYDSIINVYFPHKSVPHQVWISAEGKVLAVAGSKYLTEENIEAITSGNPVKLPTKDDWFFNREIPLLIDGNGGEPDNFFYRSLFTGYKEGIGTLSGIRTNKEKFAVGAYWVNKSLRQLVAEAYFEVMKDHSFSTMVFDVNIPEQFNLKAEPKYLYCYDLTFPPVKLEQLNVQKYLREELKRVFNISVYKESRALKCLIVNNSPELNKLATKYKNSDLDLSPQSKTKYLHNYTLSRIIKILSNRISLPLIDESNFSSPIDIDFPDKFDLSNQEELISALKKMGISIKEEVREVEVVVVTDKDVK